MFRQRKLKKELKKHRVELERTSEENQLLSNVVNQLKDFIASSVENELQLVELNDHLSKIANSLLEKPANVKEEPEIERDLMLDKVLSIDRKVSHWMESKTKEKECEALNQLVVEVTEKNNELDQKVENFSTCQICMNSYDHKSHHRCIFAGCGHVLCYECAKTISEKSKRGSTHLNKCPTCRKPVSSTNIIKIYEAT
ncbi:Oidioi.mRNA.OKI2018_I69.PAR.g11323.t1.cds [Oikopleura dioica]|uniref:Oidioi.mRNA.OKI2018_I69.PAR.g11323.t1.cds n=1 Tax=Oikopleura dioica TaxID=34765 RepID=A0ABN7RY69_OIKDI|nr:Oidioi.mRNA.OKI2018_I69.PAR.g11323.t1.cds [Oikopleura dioica]